MNPTNNSFMHTIQVTFCKMLVDTREALSSEADKIGLLNLPNQPHPGDIGDYQCDCICEKGIKDHTRVSNLFLYFIKKAVDEYKSNPKLIYKFVQDYFIQDEYPNEYDEWICEIKEIMDKNKEKKETV